MRKLREISSFMTLLAGKETITINILSDISKSIKNQTMTFLTPNKSSKTNY